MIWKNLSLISPPPSLPSRRRSQTVINRRQICRRILRPRISIGWLWLLWWRLWCCGGDSAPYSARRRCSTCDVAWDRKSYRKAAAEVVWGEYLERIRRNTVTENCHVREAWRIGFFNGANDRLLFVMIIFVNLWPVVRLQTL